MKLNTKGTGTIINEQKEYENKGTNKGTNDKDDKIARRQTRSMDKSPQKEKKKEESIAMLWMKMENFESFDNIAIYSVEISKKGQNTLKVREAKLNEVENLMKYDVFEEVDDCGQEQI